MNPLLMDALGKIARWALTFLAGWFVEHGIWSQNDATEYITAAATALVALGWSLWRSYTGRRKLVTALASERAMSERQLETEIATTGGASVTTKKHEVPL